MEDVPVSIWHWLVVLVALGIPGYIVYVAVTRARAERDVLTPGFKGWLFLLAAGVWLTPLRILGEFGRESSDRSANANQFPLLNSVDFIFFGVGLIFSIFLIHLLATKANKFVRAFIGFGLYNMVSFPLSLTVGVIVLNVVYQTPVNTSAVMAALSDDIGRWVGSCVVNIAWITYVLRSRRVALTFSR